MAKFRDLSCVLPGTVRVWFPTQLCYPFARSDACPGNPTPPVGLLPLEWVEDVRLADLAGTADADLAEFAGSPGRKLFREGMAARFWTNPTTPDNRDQIRALAVRLAADFWRGRARSWDRTYAGLVAPAGEGQTDAVDWTYRLDRCQTRLRPRPPWGEPDRFARYAPDPDCAGCVAYTRVIPPPPKDDPVEVYVPTATARPRGGLALPIAVLTAGGGLLEATTPVGDPATLLPGCCCPGTLWVCVTVCGGNYPCDGHIEVTRPDLTVATCDLRPCPVPVGPAPGCCDFDLTRAGLHVVRVTVPGYIEADRTVDVPCEGGYVALDLDPEHFTVRACVLVCEGDTQVVSLALSGACTATGSVTAASSACTDLTCANPVAGRTITLTATPPADSGYAPCTQDRVFDADENACGIIEIDCTLEAAPGFVCNACDCVGCHHPVPEALHYSDDYGSCALIYRGDCRWVGYYTFDCPTGAAVVYGCCQEGPITTTVQVVWQCGKLWKNFFACPLTNCPGSPNPFWPIGPATEADYDPAGDLRCLAVGDLSRHLDCASLPTVNMSYNLTLGNVGCRSFPGQVYTCTEGPATVTS